MKNKCKDCAARQVGCHATCDDYKAYAAYRAAENRALGAGVNVDAVLITGIEKRRAAAHRKTKRVYRKGRP